MINLKKRISDQTISLLIRMWVAGMVCLFVAWTPIGGGEIESDDFLFQIIAIIALFLFLSNILIVNPVIRGMLKTRIDKKAYYGKSVLIRSGTHLLHFAKMLAITILIWLSYILINYILGLFGIVDPYGRPVLMLEPISFGIMYGLFYLLFDKLTDLGKYLIKRKETNL